MGMLGIDSKHVGFTGVDGIQKAKPKCWLLYSNVKN